MFASFLPLEVNKLTEPTSIALAQSIERQPINTPLSKQAMPQGALLIASLLLIFMEVQVEHLFYYFTVLIVPF
jgi:hypothetical protein